MTDSNHVSSGTDENFKFKCFRVLSLLLERVPDLTAGHPSDLVRRIALLQTLVSFLDLQNPLRELLNSHDPQAYESKFLYLRDLYQKAIEEGVIDIDSLCELVRKDSESF